VARDRHPDRAIDAALGYAQSNGWTVIKSMGRSAVHEFTIIANGELTDERLDALFEAGCDDATFGSGGKAISAAFGREAPTFADAALSAIADMEKVEGVRVASVDPEEYVWASEIAERTGRSRQSVDMIIKGRRGPGSFPPPLSAGGRHPLWRWSEVDAWFAAYDGRAPSAEYALTIAGINGALQAREALRDDESGSRRLRRDLTKLLAS
jgi:predicted DNA-binding transcriptional regulator AlpA